MHRYVVIPAISTRPELQAECWFPAGLCGRLHYYISWPMCRLRGLYSDVVAPGPAVGVEAVRRVRPAAARRGVRRLRIDTHVGASIRGIVADPPTHAALDDKTIRWLTVGRRPWPVVAT